MRRIGWRIVVYLILAAGIAWGAWAWQREHNSGFETDPALAQHIVNLEQRAAQARAAKAEARAANPLAYRPRLTLPCELAAPAQLVIAPDSMRAAGLLADGTVRVWSLEDGGAQTFRPPAGVVDMALANNALAIAGDDRTAYVLDPTTGATRASQRAAHDLLSIAITADGATAYLGPQDEDAVVAWTVADGRTRRFEPLDCGDPEQLVLSPSGSYLAWRFDGASILVLQADSGVPVLLALGRAPSVRSVRSERGVRRSGLYREVLGWSEPERVLVNDPSYLGLVMMQERALGIIGTWHQGDGDYFGTQPYKDRAALEARGRGGLQLAALGPDTYVYASTRGLALRHVQAPGELTVSPPASATCLRLSPDQRSVLCYGPGREGSAIFVWDALELMLRMDELGPERGLDAQPGG